MSLTSLYLTPRDPYCAPERTDVHAALAQLAVIGEALGPGAFAAGDGFSRHVVFAGCSPHLVMTPPSTGSLQFCHVALHGPLAVPRLVTGPNTVKPRCPHCRQRLTDWREQLGEWAANDRPLRCNGCDVSLHPCEFDWREHAACGRFLVELRNVFPGEATPSDRLLSGLQDATSHPWRHAWAGCLVNTDATYDLRIEPPVTRR